MYIMGVIMGLIMGLMILMALIIDGGYGGFLSHRCTPSHHPFMGFVMK